MWHDHTHLVPAVVLDALIIRVMNNEEVDIFIDDRLQNSVSNSEGLHVQFLDRPTDSTYRIDVRSRLTGASIWGCPTSIRRGGWEGQVSDVNRRLVHGFARDKHMPERDVTVVAYSDKGVVAFASAKAAEAGAFLMILPHEYSQTHTLSTLRIAIAGSDFVLENGVIGQRQSRHYVQKVMERVASYPIRLAVKISTPNLKVAHEWGDYHFANSLKASFERIGVAASVDTNDVWYEPSRDADVIMSLRGRHRVKIDPEKINLMWLISHPDRVELKEYEDYDHVFVASDLYAQTLRKKTLTPVSVLHQATDQNLFHTFDIARREDCLFVGNSRREYRRMVRWCIEKTIPLSLYGGGWKDVVSPDLVKAENIPNSALAEYYARHLILLNDHWDTMRDQGFLSNRLFDGSAVGTPIITDNVRGLSEVFGDSITVVDSAEALRTAVASCFADPASFLARAATARDIVLKSHTFCHRAVEILQTIEKLPKYASNFKALA